MCLETGLSLLPFKQMRDEFIQTPAPRQPFVSRTLRLVEVHTDIHVAEVLHHTEYEYTPISPWRQKRYFAVTAADRFGNESAPLELNEISETDMPLLNDGDILTLPEIKEAKTVKIFTATGEEIKYFVYAPQMSIASLPGGFYTVYILNNAGAQTFVGTIVK